MKNFHSQPFDEGTTTKLLLLENYAQTWLPVFVSGAYAGATITIVDLFAGPGRDVEGRPGSPLVLLKKIRRYTELIRENRISLRLLLNEADHKKAEQLRQTINEQEIPSTLAQCEVHNLPFEHALNELFPQLERGNNLVFLDQQGMKFISEDVFSRIISLPRTDFLFFIASSFIHRFREHPHFKKHLDIPERPTGKKFNDAHRDIADHYRGLIPAGREYYLGRFSIKKGSNIYGLIFGSPHTLGMEKFLRVCWKIDKARGEANFDIDEEAIDPRAPHLFTEMDVPGKIVSFQNALRTQVLAGQCLTDANVYLECLNAGMLPAHGRAILQELVKSGLVRVANGAQARVSQDGYKRPRTLEVVER